MTVTESAADARLSKFTIYRALEAGELHGTQRVKGGRGRVESDCLDAYLAGTDCAHRSNVVQLHQSRTA